MTVKLTIAPPCECDDCLRKSGEPPAPTRTRPPIDPVWGANDPVWVRNQARIAELDAKSTDLNSD